MKKKKKKKRVLFENFEFLSKNSNAFSFEILNDNMILHRNFKK